MPDKKDQELAKYESEGHRIVAEDPNGEASTHEILNRLMEIEDRLDALETPKTKK